MTDEHNLNCPRKYQYKMKATAPDRAAIERARTAIGGLVLHHGFGFYASRLADAEQYLADQFAAAVAEAPATPVPMILFCPACGIQHVDAANPNWDNPPHKTHRCERCGHLWRPAEIATEGVADLALGTSDTRPAIRRQSGARAAAIEECARLLELRAETFSALAKSAQSPLPLNVDIRSLLRRAGDQLCHYATDYPQPEALHLINVIDRVLCRGHYSPPQSET